MKNNFGYYVLGAVIVGGGIFYYYNKKNKEKEIIVNLNPPMEVLEEVVDKTEKTIFTAFEKLKILLETIKSKGATTPTISN